MSSRNKLNPMAAKQYGNIIVHIDRSNVVGIAFELDLLGKRTTND